MAKDTVRILSFDPALTVCGWSLIEYNLTTAKRTVTKFGDITGKSAIKARKNMLGVFEKRFIILCELEDTVITLINEFNPDYIAVESAFSHRFVLAYAALVLVIDTIRRASYKTQNRDIYLIAPKEGKLAISNAGTSDKDAVQHAILAHTDIVIKDTKQNPVDRLSQHAADSIAIGYAFSAIYLPIIIALGGAVAPCTIKK